MAEERRRQGTRRENGVETDSDLSAARVAGLIGLPRLSQRPTTQCRLYLNTGSAVASKSAMVALLLSRPETRNPPSPRPVQTIRMKKRRGEEAEAGNLTSRVNPFKKAGSPFGPVGENPRGLVLFGPPGKPERLLSQRENTAYERVGRLSARLSQLLCCFTGETADPLRIGDLCAGRGRE
ncbi:hypothetical protein K0M31_010499 [Melipona bicolor]|uniref:Uncharacterized protein n=1 Tax=Melipona bicolor TaxID=60889 RepID=A0AA40KI46_9HYME|nr:hypothetical protein K0M31_010499 [Melipona bicolor]